MKIIIVIVLCVIPLLNCNEVPREEVQFNQKVVCYHVKNNKYPRILEDSLTYYDELDIWKLSDEELMEKCKVSVINRPENRANATYETNSTSSSDDEEYDKELLEFIIMMPKEDTDIPQPELPQPDPQPVAYDTFTITKEFVTPRKMNPDMYEDILCYGIHVEKCQDGFIVIINSFSQSIKNFYQEIKDFIKRVFNHQTN